MPSTPAKGYLAEIDKTLQEVKSVLQSKKIDPNYLVFGGELPLPKKIFVPTDVRSEFLANRAMGDWAEDSLAKAIEQDCLKYQVVKYGDSDSMSAGDPNFAERYKAAVEETLKLGKRPDLLIFPERYKVPKDISLLPRSNADQFARNALIGVEVRSSKQQALKYMKVRAEEAQKSGRSPGKVGLSFTVKVEDLKIVYRWIEVTGAQQMYAQVFFDSVYAINVLDIFRTIATGKNFELDKPEKSQNKTTIMIPITLGSQIGLFTKSPEFDVEIRENRLGRIDAFVSPVGGNLEIRENDFGQLIY